MDYLNQRRQHRQQRARPTGRVANAWHYFVNVMFYCILHDVDIDEQVPDEAARRVPARQDSALSLVSINEQPSNISMRTKKTSNSNHGIFQNKSTHEARHSNRSTSRSSVSASHSASGRNQDVENISRESIMSHGKKSWLSWSWSKISNKNDSSERRDGTQLNGASSSTETKDSKQDNKRASSPQWRHSAADLIGPHRPAYSQGRAGNCSFQDNLNIQDLEWVKSPRSSGIVTDDGGSVLSCSARDDNSLTSCASGKGDAYVRDMEKKTGKTQTKTVNSPSRNSWTSINSNGGKSEKIERKQSLKTEKEFKWAVPDRFGEVSGGTIPDIYELIKRTLNMGVSKPTGPSTSDASPKKEPLSGLSVKVDKHGRVPVMANVPETKTPSLHRLHTEWDETIVNIEVLLGLKKPKNSREALAVRRELGRDAPTWSTDHDDASDNLDNSAAGASTCTASEDDQDNKPAIEDIDSGVASRGVSADTTN